VCKILCFVVKGDRFTKLPLYGVFLCGMEQGKVEHVGGSEDALE
jgi:hypothetical protein